MLPEEKYIRQHGGKQQPFRVPDGYFDTLTERVMAGLTPAETAPQPLHTVADTPKRSRTAALRRWWMAAAAAVLLLLAPTAWWMTARQTDTTLADDTTVADTYFDEATDYAMVDNYDIYACLTTDN